MPTKLYLDAAICIGLIVVTVAAYSSAPANDFVSIDDYGYVVRNHHVLDGLSWSGCRYAWTAFLMGNWQPVTILSLQMDSSLWGQKPSGYITTNVALHLSNVVLVFLLLRQMTGSRYRSACVAGLFALHPLHVESVAWISERKDVLSTFFLLLTICAYVRYSIRPSLLRYLPVLLLFVLGLLAKPMIVTLPILLLLLDFWPLDRVEWGLPMIGSNRFSRRQWSWLITEKLPMFGLAFADGLVAVVAQGTAKNAVQGLTFDVRFSHMFYAYSWYLQKTFVPTDLIVFYPHPVRTLSWLSVGLGVFVVFGLTTVALWKCRKQPYVFFGWAWFVIALLPVIGLLQVGSQAYADRYVYVPHIGLFIAVVWQIHAWTQRSHAGSVVAAIVMAISLAACGLLTRAQVDYWKNSETLWTHALNVNPENSLAQLALGDILTGDGEYERAIEHLEYGIRLKPPGVEVGLSNWGRCLAALDRPVEAEQKFLTALKIDPYNEMALRDLSKLLLKQKRYAEAAKITEQYEKAFAARGDRTSNDYVTEVHLGLEQVRQKNIKQAAVHFEKAVKLAPQSAAAHNNLASAQLDLRLIEKAKSNFLRTLELNSELAGAHFNLASILESEKDLEGARHHFAEVLRIDPNDVEAAQRLARLSTN